LKTGRIEEAHLKSLVQSEIEDASTLSTLYAMGVAEEDVRAEITKILPCVVDWLRRYYGSVLVGNYVTSGHAALQTKDNEKQRKNSLFPQWEGKVTEVVDIEENIWSPRFGMKGKIDLSVKVRHRGSEVDDVSCFLKLAIQLIKDHRLEMCRQNPVLQNLCPLIPKPVAII
jgi:DNA replication ATP-dependent helicase Dna2